jgi:LmbE family N-acetylglucosaminyl deacetylase
VTADMHDDVRQSMTEPGGRGGLDVPRSALTIGAHPDDAEFGAGATLAGWAADGCEVTLLVVTDGSKGTWDPDVDSHTLIFERRREQRAAADILGAGAVIHLDHIDGELENSMALREELCRWIRTIRPQVVLTHDPWRRYMLHPDHRAAGMAAVDGVVAARDHLFFPEQGLAKHRPDILLLWQADEPDHFEDISSYFQTKIDALLCHSTQSPTTMGDATRSDEARTRFGERMAAVAADQGRPAGLRAAEAFKLLRP